MDKYLITSFKTEIANAILNMQDKLNPDKDAYISKDELKGVLDFFGVDDVSKLMKSESEQSIFENQSEDTGIIGNEDTVEISNPPADKDDAINTYGTAAYELNSKVKADLSIGTAGNPYAEQVTSLRQEQAAKMARKEDPSTVIYKISALNDLVQDYLKEHPDMEKEHLTVKEISYGKNGEKKAILSQTFGLSGNNDFNANDTAYIADSTDSTDKEEGTDNRSDDSGSGNSASAVVTYNIDFRTLNDKSKGNWHVKGTVNAGSENSDLHGAFQYTKAFDNDSSLNFTGDIRETIKDKNNCGSYGAALDYRLKKFSTGGYAMYYHKEFENVKSKESNLEIYGKYGNTFIGAVGKQYHDDLDYKYVKGLIQGKKELPNSSLTLNGGFGVEYGIVDTGQEGFIYKDLEFKVKGGVAFKSKDLSADISVNATTSKETTDFLEYSSATRTTTIGVLGKVETKNFDISTAVSSLSVKETGISDEFDTDDKTTVTASIIIGIKNLFGKKVMPILKYNVGNYDGAAQNLGAGVIITP